MAKKIISPFSSEVRRAQFSGDQFNAALEKLINAKNLPWNGDTHLLAKSHLPNVAEKPFLSIGCNLSELGTDDPRFVSIGGALLDHARGLQRVASERRGGRANANAKG